MAKHNKGEMTFLQHLEELRWHFIRSFAAILIAAIANLLFFFIYIILVYILNPDSSNNETLAGKG